MSELSDAQLSTQAQQIKNETTRKANTATRVGTHLQDVIDSKLNKSDAVAGIPTNWNFATSGASPGDYPTDLTKRYYTTDDSVFPMGTEFWTNGSGGWFTK